MNNQMSQFGLKPTSFGKTFSQEQIDTELFQVTQTTKQDLIKHEQPYFPNI